ncbi:nuclear transport factor 2 family protein [Alcanivoracaceae bacterium MT1]
MPSEGLNTRRLTWLITLLALVSAGSAHANQAGDSTVASQHNTLEDQQRIRALIPTFAWRDQKRWGDLRATFTDDGTISISWYDGAVEGFIEASKAMAKDSNTLTKHRIDSPRISICGERALAETDVTIMVRASVAGQDVDVTSYARFFDRLRRENGIWKIQARTGIYEKDRIDPVGPSILLSMINSFANYDQYPGELKHLAYGLDKKGYRLMDTVVTSGGDRENALKSEALAWLAQGGCRMPALP